MEETSNQNLLLSPQPKRFNGQFPTQETLVFTRSLSYGSNDQQVVSELSLILSKGNFPSIGRNSSPLFSQSFPERSKTNPIVFDEKFVQLEYSLSTSEDSESDSDQLLHSN